MHTHMPASWDMYAVRSVLEMASRAGGRALSCQRRCSPVQQIFPVHPLFLVSSSKQLTPLQPKEFSVGEARKCASPPQESESLK
jgi:hypothetical protein